MKDEFDEYTVRLKDMPPSFRGLVYHTDDGEPVLILNSRLTRETNGKSYLHELRHIERGDLDDRTYREYK